MPWAWTLPTLNWVGCRSSSRCASNVGHGQKRSLLRADTARQNRKHLVGLLTDDPGVVLPEGGQIVAELRPQPPMTMIGHVTSSYYSPNLGRSIALALVKNGRNRLGETLYVPLADRTLAAKVTVPRFYDLEGKRLDG